MSHTGVDVIDFILMAFYPVVALLIIEGISRLIKISPWPKLLSQGITCIGFAVTYIFLPPVPHWFTSIVLIALAAALFFQARRSKVHPDKPIY